MYVYTYTDLFGVNSKGLHVNLTDSTVQYVSHILQPGRVAYGWCILLPIVNNLCVCVFVYVL